MIRTIAVALGTAMVASACSPSLMWQWAPAETLRAEVPSYAAGKDAVFLLRERRLLLVSRWRSPDFTQVQAHDVLKILTEKGFEHAKLQVRYRKKAKFVSFEARTIGEDGSIKVVEPERVYDDDSLITDDDDDDVKVRVFAFPNVKVGSVIEYQYTLQVPFVYTGYTDWINTELPTKKYRVELRGTKDIRFALTAYNTDVAWSKTNDGDFWVVSWETEGLPATPDFDFDGYREHFDAWWAFRITQFVKYNVVSDIHRDWNTTFRWRADDLYFDNAKYYAGFEPKVDTSGCGNVACKVDKGLDYLRAEVPLGEWRGTWDGRKALTVAESRSASHFEKGRLLWKILADAGVKSWFAYSGRKLGHYVDREFPRSWAMRHSVLYLPPQDGLQAAMWVDPSCEFCSASEMPVWSLGIDAVVVEAKKGALDKRPKVTAKWLTTEGKPAIEEADSELIDVTVDADGQMKARLHLVTKGRYAQSYRRTKRGDTKDKWKTSTEELVSGRIPSASVERFDDAVDCDARVSKCTRTIEITAPGYATVDGDDLFVPLTVLAKDWANSFDKSDRTNDIRLERTYPDDDTVTVHIPAGYEVAKVPEPSTVDVTPLVATLEVEQTGAAVVIRRSIKSRMGVYPPTAQKDARKAALAFAKVRDEVLHFRKKTATEVADPAVLPAAPDTVKSP